MRLFKYEGYSIKVAPEALMLKPFKKIWDRDKSKNKEKAMNELAFLYYYCDPRSDYQYLNDDDDRLEAVKEGLGYAKDWKPDAVLKSAITFYGSFDSSAARLLRMAAKEIDKVQKSLDTMSPTNYKEIKEQISSMSMIPKIASMIQEAETKLNEEEEYGEAKGSIEKTIFDDGLDDV